MSHEPGEIEVPADAAAIMSASDSKILSTAMRVSRFDRWVEFLSAIVLSLATVATAWAGYQAALWGGEQSAHMAKANTATVLSAQKSNEAMQIGALHANLFVAWATAISEENTPLSDFLYRRFPPTLKVATDAWMATKPLKNPEAPLSPFVMPEYALPENAQAAELKQQSTAEAALADQANEISDRYVLLTVIFASVLFFGGISGKFQSQVVDMGMLIVATVVFLVGLGVLATFPVQ